MDIKFISLKFMDIKFISLKFISFKFISLKSIDINFIKLKKRLSGKSKLFAYLQKSFYNENVGFTKLMKVLKPRIFRL